MGGGWNYRIVHRLYRPGTPQEENSYSIHEVYYNEQGDINLWSKDSISAIGGTVDELLADLGRMAAAHKKPTLEWEQMPGGDSRPMPPPKDRVYCADLPLAPEFFIK